MFSGLKHFTRVKYQISLTKLVYSMYKFSVLFLVTLTSNILISPGDDLVFICNWHYLVKTEKLGKKSVYTSLAYVTQVCSEPEQVVYVAGDHYILTPESLCPPLQVYGSVAWSTDTASSGAGRLPGSGIVP